MAPRTRYRRRRRTTRRHARRQHHTTRHNKQRTSATTPPRTKRRGGKKEIRRIIEMRDAVRKRINQALLQQREALCTNPRYTPEHVRLLLILSGVDVSYLCTVPDKDDGFTCEATGTPVGTSAEERKRAIWERARGDNRRTVEVGGGSGVGGGKALGGMNVFGKAGQTRTSTVSATVLVLQEVRSFLTAAFVKAASRKKEKE